MESLFSLKDKVALVTGGTGVLGSEMAHALAAAGAKVAVLGRNNQKGNEVVRSIEKAKGAAMFLPADVTELEQLEEANEKLLDAFGKLNILVNAAGGNIPGATVGPEQTIHDLAREDIRKIIELNYLGTVLPVQAFTPSMIQQKAGVIINISSMAAQRPLTRVMGYASSKAAIDNYTQWLAVELAQKYGEGMRVNAIAPGFFLTEQNRSLLTDENDNLTDRGRQIVGHTPFKRFGSPDELTGTLIWLCSDASKFVTGTIIPVDGGFNAFSGV